MSNFYKIIIADDHQMFRQGLTCLIADRENLEVIKEVSDGIELLEVLKKMTPDMVILDLSMPRLGGLEATKEIKVTHPDVKILILTMHRNTDYFQHALAAGAEGFLLKEDADRQLIIAIDTIRRGEIYISPLLSQDLADHLAQVYRGKQHDFAEDGLTLREREVIKLIAEGKSNQEIADLLFISKRTVEHHRSNMMKKLNIKSAADLIKYALRKGYTTLT